MHTTWIYHLKSLNVWPMFEITLIVDRYQLVFDAMYVQNSSFIKHPYPNIFQFDKIIPLNTFKETPPTEKSNSSKEQRRFRNYQRQINVRRSHGHATLSKNICRSHNRKSISILTLKNKQLDIIISNIHQMYSYSMI